MIEWQLVATGQAAVTASGVVPAKVKRHLFIIWKGLPGMACLASGFEVVLLLLLQFLFLAIILPNQPN